MFILPQLKKFKHGNTGIEDYNKMEKLTEGIHSRFGLSEERIHELE